MISKYLVASVAALLATCALYFVGESTNVSPPRSMATEESTQALAREIRNGEAPRVASIRVEPKAVGSAATRTAAETVDGTEIAFGIRVRKDRNCTVRVRDHITAEGETLQVHSCKRDSPRTPHPYAQYDDETLAVMAYADAEAAAMLGKRLLSTDKWKSYELLIRASALDNGNAQPLSWISDQAFGVVKINGEPQVPNYKRRYELAALAARLDPTFTETQNLRRELIEIGVNPDEVERLDARVDSMLRAMRRIQQTVLGETTIGDPNDA